MANWIHRALFGRRAGSAAPAAVRRLPPRPAPRPDAEPLPPPASHAARALPAEPAPPDLRLPFLEWLLDTTAAPDTPLQAVELRLVARLDAVLASDTSRANLLPRAPAVIPQLLNSLRDDSQSAQALAARVTKDPLLVAAVIRLANGVTHAAAAPVADLPQAIARVGTLGLRRAIASVVLKPMFDAQTDVLSARAAPRLWQHSEAKAAESMRLAAAAGLDPFEGYLAGLMHNVGWSAALRALDRSEIAVPAGFSHAFVLALAARRDTFFGLLAGAWQLTDAMSALASELLHTGLGGARSPLGLALAAADRHATAAVLAPPVANDTADTPDTPPPPPTP